MTARGKPGKPKAGFPLFPPSLESPQKQRASHIPTAPTTSPYLTKTKHGRPYGRAENRQLGGWAKTNCRSGPKALAKARRSFYADFSEAISIENLYFTSDFTNLS